MSKSRFESFVNSERCKTKVIRTSLSFCLRALLIQKDVKLEIAGQKNPCV